MKSHFIKRATRYGTLRVITVCGRNVVRGNTSSKPTCLRCATLTSKQAMEDAAEYARDARAAISVNDVRGACHFAQRARWAADRASDMADAVPSDATRFSARRAAGYAVEANCAACHG